MEIKKYVDLGIENEPNKKLKIELYYNKGGMNYFSGQVNKRGYYLNFRMVEVSESPGFKTESFVMFGEKRDFALFLEEVGRASPKVEKKWSLILDELPADEARFYYLEGDKQALAEYFFTRK